MVASKAAANDPREPRERRNRELEVVAAAVELFYRKGYASTSVQDVADAVGVLKGSLYYYIDSKEDLLFRIFEESHRRGRELVAEAAASEGGPLQQVHHFFRHYVRWYLENVERVSLYSSETRHLTGERAERISEQRRYYDEFVRTRIQRAIDDGDAAPGLDVRYATAFAWGTVNALAGWYRPDRTMRPDDIASHYAAMILSGLTGTAWPIAG